MRFRLLAAVLFASLALPCLAERYPTKPVPVKPQERDAHTVLLATFDKALDTADFAKGAPALKVTNAEQVDGHFGMAIKLGKGGSLSLDPSTNVNAAAGTIEFVLKDTSDTARHQFLYAGSTGTQLMVQFGGSLWFTGAGAGTWVRNLNLRDDFPREWMYVVIGWDTARNIATSTIYTLEGRRFMNNSDYHSTETMKDDQKAALLKGLKTFLIRGDGVVIDAMRISDTYRAELLNPARDWGPVERWSNKSGAAKLFTDETLLQAWTAGETRVAPDRLMTFEPVIRDRKYQPTKQRRPAVPAWRCSPGTPTFKMDFGTLDIGCYVVRVIGAVATKDIDKYRKPLFVDFRVNDKVGGGESWYRHRIPYWDDFYAVTELYFNVDEKRAYRGTLTVGEGSMADLYIYRVEFHDVFAGLPRKAAKTKPGLFTFEERERLRKNVDRKAILQKVRQETHYSPLKGTLTPAQRQARDDMLWNAFPPLNSQFIAEYDEGFFTKEMRAGDKTLGEVAKEFGSWQMPGGARGWYQPMEFTNEKLGLTYTREDLENHRPLPDPYPYKDAGLGVYFPPTAKTGHATHFLPLAEQLGRRWQSCWLPLGPWHGGDITYRVPYLYHALGDENAARDAALLLARWAWTYPTHTDQQTLGYALIAPASMYNRDMRLVMRAVMFYWGSPRGANLIGGLTEGYDYLFDYIKGNDELAKAVGRYIPWVKTEADVRRLIETRLLQFSARQTDRYYHVSSKNHAQYYLHTILVQQDPDTTRPWIESLWKRTHIYPHGDAGLPDFISSTTQRDGTTDIGSVFYTHGGSPFLDVVAMTRRYVANGGDARFDLSGPEFGAKMSAACRFFLDSAISGGFPLTIGDVGNPYKRRLFYAIENWEQNVRWGWEWTRDPRFAALLTRYYGRRAETDEEWAAIEEASKAFQRNPFLAQGSRLMANWAGILAEGEDSDDFRFQRTAYMRVGMGHGHAHGDTLDLQMMAHGVRVMNDVGHRGSYGQPSPGATILHNLMEVNGDGGRGGMWTGHAHIPTLVTTPGAQYMEGVAAVPLGGVRKGVKRTRAVAMVEVDAGAPGTAKIAPLPYSDKTKAPSDAVTPSSYLFDVQRVDGGKVHTFCFHGTYSDDFDVNIDNKSFAIDGEDKQYLRKFLRGDVKPYVGDTPDTLVATWRLRRSTDPVSAILRYAKEPISIPQTNAEQIMLGATYSEAAPRVFTRLHLLGQRGKHEMVGWIQPFVERAKMTWPFLMVQQRGDNLSDVYTSVIEPYRGEPFIESVRLVDIPGNAKGADAAVAVQVTLKNGRTDLCFADAQNTAPRAMRGAKIASRYAYVSRDAQGLRMAQLVGGTTLELPEGTLSLPAAQLEAKVESADYLSRYVALDRTLDTKPFMGAVVELGNDAHRTSFTVVGAANFDGGNGTVLALDKAIDLGYSAVTGVRPATRHVGVRVAPVAVQHDGKNAGLTCTNADMTKQWHCRYVGRDDRLGHVYELDGDVTEADLPVGSLLRVWEFGKGDAVRLTTHATLRRAADGTLKVESPFAATWAPAR